MDLSPAGPGLPRRSASSVDISGGAVLDTQQSPDVRGGGPSGTCARHRSDNGGTARRGDLARSDPGPFLVLGQAAHGCWDVPTLRRQSHAYLSQLQPAYVASSARASLVPFGAGHAPGTSEPGSRLGNAAADARKV